MPEPQTITDIVSAKIRGAMAERGVTQAELGQSLGLGLGHQAISARLNGRVVWSLPEVIEAARFLDVPLDRIIPNDITGATP